MPYNFYNSKVQAYPSYHIQPTVLFYQYPTQESEQNQQEENYGIQPDKQCVEVNFFATLSLRGKTRVMNGQ